MIRWFRDITIWPAILATATILTLLVSLNIWALQNPYRYDLTIGQVHSISSQTRAVIGAIKQKVTITFFYDVRSRAMNDARALLDQYADASPLITVNSFDPMLEPAIAEAHQVRFAGTTIITSGEQNIRVTGGSEGDFTNGLIRATRQAQQLLCFTEGHLESDPFSLQSHDHTEEHGVGHSHGGTGHGANARVVAPVMERLELHESHGIGQARGALEVQGYRVEKRLLVNRDATLDECDAVIVASPQRQFTTSEASRLGQYLQKGGDAMIMLEPEISSGLEDVLAGYGIAVGEKPVRDDDAHFWTDPFTPAVANYPRHKITRNLALTVFPGILPLRPLPSGVPDGTLILPLVESSNRDTLVLLAKQGDSQIIVAGDGDFATNSFFPTHDNGRLFLKLVNYITRNEDLIEIVPRYFEPSAIRLTNRQMQVTFITSAVVLPLLAIGWGFFLRWRRR